MWAIAALVVFGLLCTIPYHVSRELARVRAAWAHMPEKPSVSVRLRHGWALAVPRLTALVAGALLVSWLWMLAERQGFDPGAAVRRAVAEARR